MFLLKGRELLNRVVVANEVVDELKRKIHKWVIVKVDFKKVYDWDFLYYMSYNKGIYGVCLNIY